MESMMEGYCPGHIWRRLKHSKIREYACGRPGCGAHLRPMSFAEMLTTIRTGHELSQKELAAALGISPQYVHDLEHGRRLPSVKVIERICDHFRRGPQGRSDWHVAGARAHGWDV